MPVVIDYCHCLSGLFCHMVLLCCHLTAVSLHILNFAKYLFAISLFNALRSFVLPFDTLSNMHSIASKHYVKHIHK